MNFSTDLFDAGRPIDRMVQQFQVSGRGRGSRAGSKHCRAAAAGRGAAAGDVRPLERYGPGLTIAAGWCIALFEAQASGSRTPWRSCSAISDGPIGELNERANQLARYLQPQGVGPESPRGNLPGAIAAAADGGVGRAEGGRGTTCRSIPPTRRRRGGAFASTCSRRPGVAAADRFRAARGLDTGATKWIVLDGETLDEIAREGRDDLDGAAAAENLAYILYTSGSTGRPKGVMVTQGNLLNAYYGWQEAYRLGTEVAVASADGQLRLRRFRRRHGAGMCSGGKLVICRKEILLDPGGTLGA